MGWIEPDWPAPPRVRALSTTRRGGVSTGVYADWNLGDHVGDDPAAVARNRALLRERLGLPAEPRWLRQVHGCAVAAAGDSTPGCEADAVVAFSPGEVCAVLTADCLPVLLCDRAGTRVGAVHAGWRGLAEGVVESAVAALAATPREILCWLGPAIGPNAFEVGPGVRARFLEVMGPGAARGFRPGAPDRWFADLSLLARLRLAALGVTAVFGGDVCTHSDPARFFSFRRDGTTGRMATLVWIEPGP